LLGGAQGFMGWYMVKSGLVDNPAVSHYRLAAHLSLAFLILSCLLWLALSLSAIKRHPSKPLFIHALIALAFVTMTILWGAFTAGLDAGLVYNDTFPKMGGQWVPPDFWAKDTLLANMLENHGAVQFTHRWLAVTTAVIVFSLWLHGLIRKQSFPMLHALMAMILIQIALGIMTLFTDINIHVAATHQAGAVIVLCLLVSVLFQARMISSSTK
jgi:cytochrome c oxidase assembly protein subunit 15